MFFVRITISVNDTTYDKVKDFADSRGTSISATFAFCTLSFIEQQNAMASMPKLIEEMAQQKD